MARFIEPPADTPFNRQLAEGHKFRTGHKLEMAKVSDDGVLWQDVRLCCGETITTGGTVESIQFKGKENLSEVQEFLNRNNVRNAFRVREAFTRNGKDYPSVDVLTYEDEAREWRVLTPGRWVGIEHGKVLSHPEQP